MEIIIKGIEEIRPYENNPRVNDGAVGAVAESIREFGFQQPIVVDRDGVIIAGHTRYKAVESMGTDSLSTVMLSAIAHRGSEADSENIAKLCATKKFWSAPSAAKEATLTKYFDMDDLFAAKTPEDLPSRYLRTYAQVEKAWGKTPLEVEERRRRNG